MYVVVELMCMVSCHKHDMHTCIHIYIYIYCFCLASFPRQRSVNQLLQRSRLGADTGFADTSSEFPKDSATRQAQPHQGKMWMPQARHKGIKQMNRPRKVAGAAFGDKISS